MCGYEKLAMSCIVLCVDIGISYELERGKLRKTPSLSSNLVTKAVPFQIAHLNYLDSIPSDFCGIFTVLS